MSDAQFPKTLQQLFVCFPVKIPQTAPSTEIKFYEPVFYAGECQFLNDRPGSEKNAISPHLQFSFF